MSSMLNEQIVLLEATIDDAPEVIEYVKTVADQTDFLTFGSSEFTLTIQEEAEIIREHQLADNQLFVIARINGRIAGILNVKSSQKQRLRHIGEFGISVLEEHWGKGVGTQLIRYMIQWARRSAVIRKLNLKVLANNPKAIKLYEKMGFKLEGVITRDFLIHGKFVDSLYMGMLID